MEPEWVDAKFLDNLNDALLHFDELTEDDDPTTTLQSFAHEFLERLKFGRFGYRWKCLVALEKLWVAANLTESGERRQDIQVCLLDTNFLDLLFHLFAETTGQVIVERTLVVVELAANNCLDLVWKFLCNLGLKTTKNQRLNPCGQHLKCLSVTS